MTTFLFLIPFVFFLCFAPLKFLFSFLFYPCSLRHFPQDSNMFTSFYIFSILKLFASCCFLLKHSFTPILHCCWGEALGSWLPKAHNTLFLISMSLAFLRMISKEWNYEMICLKISSVKIVRLLPRSVTKVILVLQQSALVSLHLC